MIRYDFAGKVVLVTGGSRGMGAAMLEAFAAAGAVCVANYFADPETIRRIEERRQVIFRYTDALGEVSDQANPNGSLNNIAGICNEARNVVGLMPHPERASEAPLGSADGRVVLASVVKALAAARGV